MQNRAVVATLLFATFTGLFFAAACSDSGDDGASTGAGVEQPDATADTGIKVLPSTDGGTFIDDDSSIATTTSDAGGTTYDGGTCLVVDPIDQTQYRYIKAASVLPASCTEDELAQFTAYYEAFAANPDFSLFAWEQVVSAKCRSCIFVDDGLRNATVWRPIVFVGDAIDVVDVGGCAEHLSGSEACGRAFQQYEDCQNEACVHVCTTQADYAACRADPRMFTTACKAATDAVDTACGQANVNQYEAECNYGATFEGPIRIGCMGGADAGADGGADAGADAGDSGAADGGDAGTDGGT